MNDAKPKKPKRQKNALIITVVLGLITAYLIAGVLWGTTDNSPYPKDFLWAAVVTPFAIITAIAGGFTAWFAYKKS